MAVLPIFGQKWDIIAHNTRTITRKKLVTNGMNVTTIQLSFGTPFTAIFLTDEFVLLVFRENVCLPRIDQRGFESHERPPVFCCFDSNFQLMDACQCLNRQSSWNDVA